MAPRVFTKSMLTPFVSRPQRCAVLDGGMGTALGNEAQKDVLWGTQLLFTSKGLDQVRKVHRSFLEAGADVIGSNTYQMSCEMLETSGFYKSHPLRPKETPSNKEAFVNQYLKTAVELAKS